MHKKLSSGDLFPETSLNVIGGETLQVPLAEAPAFTLVLFYRGHW